LLPPVDDLPAGVAEPVAPAPAEDRPAVTGIKAFRIYWWLSFAAIFVDQVAKAIVSAKLPLVYESYSVIPGLFDIIHVHNEPVAFGLLNDRQLPFKGWLTTALAVLALVGIGFYARHVRPEERLARVGLSLILGGAIGNLADRLRQNYVVDFMDVYWRGWHFWAFNIADACITLGAILVFVDLLFVTRHHASHSL
jgi:signal peptidase II